MTNQINHSTKQQKVALITIGYQGQIVFDTTKPDGTPRKLMNSQRLESMGWKAKVNLSDGLLISYKDFLSQEVSK